MKQTITILPDIKLALLAETGLVPVPADVTHVVQDGPRLTMFFKSQAETITDRWFTLLAVRPFPALLAVNPQLQENL